MPSAPNVLLITCDHLRYDTLGCTGDPVIRTPTIDRLAEQSVLFDRCFVQNPVCQPSRASLMTGRYPRHHGVRHNGSALSENEVTLMEFMHRRGYQTASVGKHHIRQDRFLRHCDIVRAAHCRRNWRKRSDGCYEVTDPNEFERYVLQRGHEYRTGYALPGFRERLGAVPSALPEDCHLDAYVAMKARETLAEFSAERPFFLWLGFYGPHHPYVPSGRFATMYDPQHLPACHRSADDLARKPVEYRLYCTAQDHKYRGFTEASEQTFRAMKAAYYGMVSQIDWALSGVLEQLSQRGGDDNTVVVLTSDHGEFLGDHGIPAKAPFLLDCMLHVPLILRAPGLAPGTVDGLVEGVDIFPTIAELVDADIPDWVQGRSLLPLAESEDRAGDGRDRVYAEMVDKRAIRTRDWKYIHYPKVPRGELYDLRQDPHELHNLYDDRPEKVAEMQQRYYELMDCTEDAVHPSYQRFTGVDPETGETVTHYHTW